MRGAIALPSPHPCGQGRCVWVTRGQRHFSSSHARIPSFAVVDPWTSQATSMRSPSLIGHCGSHLSRTCSVRRRRATAHCASIGMCSRRSRGSRGRSPDRVSRSLRLRTCCRPRQTLRRHPPPPLFASPRCSAAVRGCCSVALSCPRERVLSTCV